MKTSPIIHKHSDGSVKLQYHVDCTGMLQGSFQHFAKNGGIIVSTNYIDGVEHGVRLVNKIDGKTFIEQVDVVNGEYTNRQGPGLYNYEECAGCNTRLLVDLKGVCYVKDCTHNPKTINK